MPNTIVIKNRIGSEALNLLQVFDYIIHVIGRHTGSSLNDLHC